MVAIDSFHCTEMFKFFMNVSFPSGVTIGIVPPPGSGTGGPPTFVVPEGVPDVMVCVEITSGSLERDVIVMLDTMDGQLADPASNAQGMYS